METWRHATPTNFISEFEKKMDRETFQESKQSVVHPQKTPNLKISQNKNVFNTRCSPHRVGCLFSYRSCCRSTHLRCKSSQQSLTLLAVTDVRFHPGTSLTAAISTWLYMVSGPLIGILLYASSFIASFLIWFYCISMTLVLALRSRGLCRWRFRHKSGF